MDVLTQKQKREIRTIEDIQELEAHELNEEIMSDILSYVGNNLRYSESQ